MPSPDFDTVSLVTVDENQDAFVVGLLEDQTGDGAYLIFQCGLTPPDGQDAVTGLDSYCLLDEDGAVQYGGVLRVSLNGGTLTLELSEEAAEELGVDDADRSITLTVPIADAPRLSAGLRRIFTYGNPDKQPQLVGL
ncbi:MAG: hypothetical protein J2P25_14855 [Nocardiopsaceae bacterium]|nr:hypothetical protein [Nocardiopsaceae bacterium]